MKKALISFMSKNKFDKLLLEIYILNIFDYLFTLVLISSGLFIEVNPLLINIKGTNGFALKCVLPLILLVYLHTRLSISPPKNEKPVKVFLYMLLSYYAVINAFHIFWLCYSVVMFI